MDERRPLRPGHRVEAWIRVADSAYRGCSAMRLIGSPYIRSGLAATHVHCTRPLAARNGTLESWFDRYKLLIIKYKNPRMPERGHGDRPDLLRDLASRGGN